MDKITDSYIDSILRNSHIETTVSHMSCVMMATLPNGYIVSAVYPFLGDPDNHLKGLAEENCKNQIRRKIREFETYHLLCMQHLN